MAEGWCSNGVLRLFAAVGGERWVQVRTGSGVLGTAPGSGSP